MNGKNFLALSTNTLEQQNLKDGCFCPPLQKSMHRAIFRISLNQEKIGRTITHFQILIKKIKDWKTKEESKPNRDPNTVDIFANITDAQIAKYSMIFVQIR